MKMKKIVLWGVLLALCVMLCGCGEKAAAELDAEALTDALLNGNVFSVTLEELSASKATAFYGVESDKLQSATLYHASGVSKEQIALFHATDETAAAQMVTQLQSLLEDWIESDRDYAPDEVPKLEKAVLRQSGEWVVLVVANDPAAAAQLVGQYI